MLNANAVARQDLRLFVTTGTGQSRPKSYLKCVKPTRKAVDYLRSKPEYNAVLKAADEVDEAMDHPLIRLMQRVNPAFDKNRLIRYTSLCLDTVGRAHWLPGDDTGNPMGTKALLDSGHLWPLLAQYVLPFRTDNGSLVTNYSYFSMMIDPLDMISFRGDSLRDPYALGQSAEQAGFAFIGLSDSFTQMMETLMTQSVKPSVIVTNRDPEEPIGEPERKRLQRDINYQLSAGGAGKAWVLDGALDVKNLVSAPVGLAENEINEASIKSIFFLYGVPLSFYRNEDSNRAISEAGHYQHAKLGVEPRCINIASTLTKWTHMEGERRGQDWSRLLWAFDNPVKEDEEREAKIFDMQLKSGVKTINEIRMHLGYDAVPWGDEPWFPGTLLQPSTAAEQRDLAQKNTEMGLAAKASQKPGETPDEADADAGSVDDEESKTLAETANILLARINEELDEPIVAKGMDGVYDWVRGSLNGNGVHATENV